MGPCTIPTAQPSYLPLIPSLVMFTTQKFADQYPDVIAAKVDVDEASEVAEQQGITAMPTFKLYVDGKEIKEVCGASEHAVEDLFKN